jgi:hypothetical protein
MRVFYEKPISRAALNHEAARRRIIAHTRAYAASQGFHGRISFAYYPPDTNTRGVVPIAIRVWARP